jgi:hypothetical protein
VVIFVEFFIWEVFKNIKIMNYKIYGIDTLVEFGRYKGKTIIEIAKEDKKYLEWFLEEIDNVALDRELFNNDIIQSLPSNIISILRNRLSIDDEYLNKENIYKYNNVYRYEEDDIWADIAGSNDPDDMETAYWNLD